MSGNLAADLEALFAAQSRLETVIERAARQQREQQSVPDGPDRRWPDRRWLDPLPYLPDRCRSPDVGPQPHSCQWLYGERPFTDADRCGALAMRSGPKLV